MVRITMRIQSKGLPWQIILALSSLIIAPLSEAYYPANGPQPAGYNQQQQQALNDYYLQTTGLLPEATINNAHLPVDGQVVSMDPESAKYQLAPDHSGYGTSEPTQLDQIDLQKLVAYLAQLQTIKDNYINESTLVGDLNSHLSPTDPERDMNTISGPINDPADSEAILGQLTNTINHEMPNVSNRSAILDSLLSVYLGTIMQQLKQQQQLRTDNDADSNNNIIIVEDGDSDSIGATTEAELRASSVAPASRYGSGEYIDHPLALIGHQYVQGGAGEGRQLLGPDGAFENVQVVKSDHAAPSYCDPPNPCPIGYTAEDGCLEKFVNSASFSREYQVKQQCSCDNEHSLFNCASPISTLKNQEVYSSSASPPGGAQGGDGNQQKQQQQQQVGSGGDGGDGRAGSFNPASPEGSDQQQSTDNLLETLARAIQNRFGSLASVRNLIGNHEKMMTNQATDIDEPQYSNIVKKGFQIGSDFKY